MKTLTLWQPWATLVALLVKLVETRSWATSYRGPVAIHAAKRLPAVPDKYGWVGRFNLGRWADYVVHADPCDCDEDEEELGKRCAVASNAVPALFNDEGAHGFSLAAKLPLGAVVATAQLVDCLEVVEADDPYGVERPMAMVVNRDRTRLWHKVGDTVADFTDQLPYGDYTPGRYAWLLERIEPLDEPVPARGKQGLWEWDRGAWMPEHGGLVLL